ncbi:ATP-dependent DNA ligase [Punctularia strigosozonata HHB-11173 SS5]|uniref:ATP-dependent DNA ligase n=1 Tax=Punctularia strigosozonata (strain HHB-11173) TaxID=741275 RepID=UPI000441763D|nr:ATP-dependent DNA ligase [Punctularia strigosozonata HHB-11173 SS5]EIN09548.1 ATP-dependent DNA ligase [Punctularia strigosozonata HHB-11173 SS5]
MLPTPAPSSPPRSPRQVPASTQQDGTSYPAPPPSVGSAPFYVLIQLFEKLQNERKPERRKRLLDGWFNHWRQEIGYDLYPVLRLILPQKDRERAVYGLKEKNLAKAYIKLIPLGMKDADAIRLLNWKKPADKDRSSGDFPTVLYEVVNKRSSVIKGLLTVHELNDVLDELSQNIGKQDVQSRILQRVYNRSTPEEQRWIVRIILKDMTISVKETTVFSVFHPDAHDLFNTCSDLKKVVWELWDPKRRLNAADKTIQLFRSFAPMLCKRPTRRLEDSVKEMGGRTFFIEEKLDGERMQLHKRGNEYFYCSRKGKDYTYLYGKHVGMGSLTPFIDKAFDSRVEDIILDGEMLVWDPVSGRNLPFGTLKTAALDRTRKEQNPRPCFKVFDLLYLNGMPLLQKSTKFRRRNLRACLTPIPGRIELVSEFEGKTAKDVRTRMEEVMENRGEGLIIKHPDSEYVLNGRNKDWIKVKPEYMDNMGETVDVLVVAGNYGTGHRGGGVSTLVCAVLDDRRRPEEDDEPKYASVVRIGSGLSFADYVWIRSKPWKIWAERNPPSFYLTAPKGTEDKGDVYLEPEDSFIIKVKAAEIVTSDLYYLGFTMRFPRAVNIRDDLSVADCMTATEFLAEMSESKKRKVEEETVKPEKKRKTASKVHVLSEYGMGGSRLKDVAVESVLFRGMRFMVVSDPKSRTGDEDKRDLMKLIHANGGKVAQVVSKKFPTLVVYGGSTIPYDIRLIMQKDEADIIKPQWIFDCLSQSEVIPMTKKYFFHATSRRQETDEYRLPDDDTVMAETANVALRPAIPTQQEDPEPKEEEDPSLTDWFNVKGDATAHQSPPGSDTESETEPESDNEDTKEEDTEDGWYKIENLMSSEDAGRITELAEVVRGPQVEEEAEAAKMGEDDEAMEYDQNLIFKHLCFYLDTPMNARNHGMPIKTKHESDIQQRFVEIDRLIRENGGRVADLDDPKLTHIVLDKRDDSRRRELTKRTSK